MLVGLLSTYLLRRYPELAAGRAVPADIVVFAVWIALLLAPLFKEVSLLGITLKQQLDELKSTITSEISEFKSEIRNAVTLQATISPQITIPAPAADAQLPEIEKRIKAALSDALAEHGVRQPPPPAQVHVPQDVELLFATRYNLEKELRRIGESRKLTGMMGRPLPAMQLTRQLVATGLLEPPLANAIREVYSVCSPAVHGEPVTDAQVAFVRDIGPSLIAALKAIA